jgi:[NiFe] hydrogenase assembly HybE family chaperone
MSGFEGSFLGDGGRITGSTRLECGVCWWVYDPAVGDETWQIPAGTGFAELPAHWRCPNCDNPREQFMVLGGAGPVPGGQVRPRRSAGLEKIRQVEDQLQQAYAAIDERMRSLPVYNDKLDIQVHGLRRWSEGLLGVVATPWCMNIVLVPAADAPHRMEGTTRSLHFPLGTYNFTAGQLPGLGALETCSLFSPMDDFDDPAVVGLVAEHAINGLFEQPRPSASSAAMGRRDFLRGGRRGDERAGR